MLRQLLRFACLASLVVSPVIALAGPDARDHDIVAEDYFTIGTVTNAVIAPDGKYVAYTELRWEPPADKRNLDLWVVDTATRARTRLTFDRASDSGPKWAPDGRWIYFTSSRKQGDAKTPPYNGKKQVWRIRPDGGPLQAVTRLEEGVQQFHLSTDGKTLYYTATEKQWDDEWKDEQKKHEHLEYGWGVVKFSQVWSLDLESWRTEKLIDEKRVVTDFAVSPDERHIAMITTPTDQLIHKEGWSRVDLWERASEEVTTLTDTLWREQAPSPYGWLENLSWSTDSRRLAFTVDFDGFPGELLVAEFGSGEPVIQRLQRPPGVSCTGSRPVWRGSSDLCFIGEHRARARVFCITDIASGKHGQAQVLTPGDVCAHSLSLSRDGQHLAATIDTVTHPPDIFLYPAARNAMDRAAKRLTTVNPQVDTWKLPQMKLVTWKGWNGDEVEGVLELPPDYQEADGPLPLIVELHGGPTASSLYRMRFWIYGRVLMAARGYALLTPNYRGSTGYGDQFMTELVGHENDREVIDIMNGVDALIERGIADADRLGVMGWSNGGYLTNCLITQTNRFKAASSGAGIIDMALQWSVEDTPGHVINFQTGLPWETPDVMREASPLFEIHKAKTPTIIHVGGDDPRCPPAHSKALFRALHEYLKVPTQLIVYPGEGHSPMTYKNRKAKMDWDLAWFDKYLPVKTEEETEKDTQK